MYIPKFSINNEILKNIGTIEAAREVVNDAPLVPSYEKKFQDEAVLRTVYHGTHIEGNDLSLDQTKQVLEGQQIVAKERDIQEIMNYRNVVRFLDTVEKLPSYGLHLLLKLHSLTTEKILPEGEVGKIRQTQVILRDGATGQVTFRPPPAIEVPFLLQDFLNWLNSREGKEVHPVLRAGISHYVLVAIHPFVEGNGRVARAFATLVLFAEGYNIKRLFSLEEYFDQDSADYYSTLQDVSSQSDDIASRDFTPWLIYFTRGLAIELTKVKEQVKKLSIDLKMKDRVGGQVELSPRQLRLMEHISKNSPPLIRMRDAKRLLPMISEDTILRELQSLVREGIIKREGSGRGARYRLRT